MERERRDVLFNLDNENINEFHVQIPYVLMATPLGVEGVTGLQDRPAGPPGEQPVRAL